MYSAATSRVGPLRIMKSWGWTHFFLHLIRPPQQAAVSNGSRSFVASWRVWVFTAACVREAASFRSWIRPQCRVTCTRYVEEKMERQNKIGWHKNKIWNAKNKNGQQKERKTLDQDTGPKWNSEWSGKGWMYGYYLCVLNTITVTRNVDWHSCAYYESLRGCKRCDNVFENISTSTKGREAWPPKHILRPHETTNSRDNMVAQRTHNSI